MRAKPTNLFRGPLGLLLALFFIPCGSIALAQGTVMFYNYTVSLKTHIYLGGDHQIAGNGPNDYPAGTQDWTGFTGLLGTGYTAQLWAANGPDQPESSLQPVVPTTTFQTLAAAAGVLINAGDLIVPGVPELSVASMTLRVWDNRGGTITSWAMAQTAGVSVGEAPLFNIRLGGFSLPAAQLVGLESFNIYQVPEPSALTLVGLGALPLWFAALRIKITWDGQVREKPLHLTPNDYQHKQDRQKSSTHASQHKGVAH